MISENVVICANPKYPLNGILTIPESSEPVPAVVFVHGSGPSNKDEKIGGLTPFKDLAEGLAQFGIASVRYDKRSFAHGLKMVTDKNLEVIVTSANGRVVERTTLRAGNKSLRLNTSRMDAGLYNVTVLKNGQKVENAKVIVR